METTTSPKYATYSQSEIDRMLKAQGENIIASVSAKVASQQKNLQEAVDERERNFKKTADRLLGNFEETRMMSESSMKEQRDKVRKELDQYKADLVKELDQFKTQITKGFAPNVKLLDEKIKTLEEMLKAPSTPQPVEKDNRALYIAIAAAVLAAINTALFFVKH